MALQIDDTVTAFLDQYVRKVVQAAVDGDADTAVADLKRAMVAAATDDEDFFLIVGGGDPMLREHEDEAEEPDTVLEGGDEAVPEEAPEDATDDVVDAVLQADSLRDYLGHDTLPSAEHDEV